MPNTLLYKLSLRRLCGTWGEGWKDKIWQELKLTESCAWAWQFFVGILYNLDPFHLSIKSLRKKHIFCAASKWRCVGWCDEMSVHVSVKRGDCKEIQLTRPLHAAVKLLRPMPWPCDCRYRWQVRQAWLVQACAILGEAFIIKQKYNICQLNFPQFTF